MFYYTFMEKSPRAEALSLISSGQQVPPPPLPEDIERNTPEALEFLASIKGPHYASLALAIDVLFEKTLQRRTDTAPYGLVGAPAPYVELTGRVPFTGWQKLGEDMGATFTETLNGIRDEPAFINAEKYVKLVSNLDSHRHIDLWCQLHGGVGTGVISTFTLLRNAPHIIHHHDPETSPADIGEILRHPNSMTLLRRLAKISVNQMMAARSALVGETTIGPWSSKWHEMVMDPTLFQLQADTQDRRSLVYADFDNLTVPQGYTPHHTVKPMECTTLVRDIPGHQPTTIGCPVTLLQGRLAELLDWGVDIVEGEKMWDAELATSGQSV
jgi:hypothetical protein